MRSSEERLKNTLWRVIHYMPGVDSLDLYKQKEERLVDIYSDRGEEARIKAEEIYNSLTRTRGEIGLYRGIFAVKMRKADKLPKRKRKIK